MTIHLPDELARGLAGIAAAQNKSVEQLALERLQSLLPRPTSPAELLRLLRSIAPLSAGAVDDLEASIRDSRLPVRDTGIFDE